MSLEKTFLKRRQSLSMNKNILKLILFIIQLILIYYMDERKFFDNLAPTWDTNEVLSTPGKVSEILKHANIKPGESVLDLGTGTGVLIPQLSQLVGPKGKIMAVDYSQGMLDIAIRKNSGVIPVPTFANVDFETETIEGVFDHILLYCVYPHLHTPVDTLKWLRAVNLAENGTITIAFPTDENFINSIHRQKHSESDCLPPAHKLAETLRQHGLDAAVVKADKESYIINIV